MPRYFNLNPPGLKKRARLRDLDYDRNECVEAIRDFYRFLVKVYLPESEVIEPPEGG